MSNRFTLPVYFDGQHYELRFDKLPVTQRQIDDAIASVISTSRADSDGNDIRKSIQGMSLLHDVILPPEESTKKRPLTNHYRA